MKTAQRTELMFPEQYYLGPQKVGQVDSPPTPVESPVSPRKQILRFPHGVRAPLMSDLQQRYNTDYKLGIESGSHVYEIHKSRQIKDNPDRGWSMSLRSRGLLSSLGGAISDGAEPNWTKWKPYTEKIKKMKPYQWTSTEDLGPKTPQAPDVLYKNTFGVKETHITRQFSFTNLPANERKREKYFRKSKPKDEQLFQGDIPLPRSIVKMSEIKRGPSPIYVRSIYKTEPAGTVADNQKSIIQGPPRTTGGLFTNSRERYYDFPPVVVERPLKQENGRYRPISRTCAENGFEVPPERQHKSASAFQKYVETAPHTDKGTSKPQVHVVPTSQGVEPITMVQEVNVPIPPNTPTLRSTSTQPTYEVMDRSENLKIHGTAQHASRTLK